MVWESRRRRARRGLSTSASFLIVFVGVVLAFSSLYTVGGNTTERVADAREDHRERHEAVQLTGVTVVNATWYTADSTLSVRVNNTGETTLSVDAVDTVVDGTYVPIGAYERAEVDGVDTDIWEPGEQLHLEDTDPLSVLDGTPERVRVVTGPGVADVREVTEQ